MSCDVLDSKPRLGLAKCSKKAHVDDRPERAAECRGRADVGCCCRYAEELRHRKDAIEEEDEEVDGKLEEPSVRR